MKSRLQVPRLCTFYTQWWLNENCASSLGCRVSLCSLRNGETSMHIQPYKDWDWPWSLLIYGDCWSLFHILITTALQSSDSAKSSGITEVKLHQDRCNPAESFEILQTYLIKTGNFILNMKMIRHHYLVIKSSLSFSIILCTCGCCNFL